MKSLIRNVIIIAVVLSLGYAGYKFFLAPKPGETDALQTTTNDGNTTSGSASVAPNSLTASAGTPVGQDFLTLLLNVQSIKLDDTIFTSKAFTLLQDFNRPIPPDTNPGRPNPFAALGIDGAAVSSQVSTSIPSSVTTTGSTLNGTLTVGGPGVTRWFEYGTTTALGTITTVNSQSNPGAFSDTVVGLTPNTTYYVKAGASIGGVIIGGNLVTWKTAQGGTQAPVKPVGSR